VSSPDHAAAQPATDTTPPAPPMDEATSSSSPEPAYPMALEPPDPTLAAGAAPPAGVTVPGGTAPSGGTAPPGGTAESGQTAGTAGTGAAGTAGRRPRPVALVLISAVAAVGLVASSVFGYLWWDRQRTLDDTRAQLTAEMAELRETADQREMEIDRLLRELQGAADETAAAVQALEGARNMVELLQDEQGVIRRCLALNAEMLDAIFTNNQAAFEAVVDEAEEVCGQASEILGR
jgi:hypothetical protein